MSDDRPLNPKQSAFVREYLIDLNATQAAIRAGYSPKTAYVIAGENLKKPHIQAALQKALADRAAKTEISAEWVLQGLKKEAEGRGPDTNASARTRAFELVGKHLGMLVERTENKTETTVKWIDAEEV